jgi:crotonobetainyl-CoA:carnitine CoA-transferase CaiB-like acyl-CoA transferase
MVANPIKLSKTPTTVKSLGPAYSEHTEQILLELGYTWEDIAQLKQENIIP